MSEDTKVTKHKTKFLSVALSGCKVVSVMLTEEQRQRVFEHVEMRETGK
jgi:hypothetical protein